MQTGSDIVIIDEVSSVDATAFYYNLKHELYGQLEKTVPDTRTICTFLFCLKHAALPVLPIEMLMEIVKHLKVQVYICAYCKCRIELHKEHNISFQGAVCSVECANLSGIFLVKQNIAYRSIYW